MSGPIYNIAPSHIDSNQSVPRAVINFYPFAYVDTFHSNRAISDADSVKASTITVVSDIIDCSVTSNKSSPTIEAQVVLAAGHLDYGAQLVVGDHAAIWMMSDTKTFERISRAALVSQPANDSESGLKFIGRITGIRDRISYSADGKRTVEYVINLTGFSELTSQIYYNPYLPHTFENSSSTNPDEKNLKRFSLISDRWLSLIPKDGTPLNTGVLIDFFIDVFLGSGPNKSGVDGIDKARNTAFYVPNQIGRILGLASTSSSNLLYADILHTFIGIQSYRTGRVNDLTRFVPQYIPSGDKKNQRLSVVNILNKENKSEKAYKLYGDIINIPDPFTNGSIWSILQAHSNTPMNEMYTTMRVNDDGRIYPTLIARQIPFTTKFAAEKLGRNVSYTKFSDLPVWKIDNRMLQSIDIGTTEAARVNFVQLYADVSKSPNPANAMVQQIAMGNYQVDSVDIARNGARSLTLNSRVDIASGETATNLSSWARIVGDFHINGHLKANGTAQLVGIKAPIAIGDNCQIEDKILHIEAINHSYSCDRTSGKTSFVTGIYFSNGMLTNGNYPVTSNQGKKRSTSNSELRGRGYTDEGVYVAGQQIVSGKDKK